MCWNAPVSMATFISSTVICAYLWKRNIINDKPLAIFILCFSSMQLFEFFMWRDMKGHTLSSKLSLFFLLLQPFSLAAALYYFRPNLYKSLWEKLVLLITGLISLLKAAAATFYAFVTDAKGKWLSVKGPNCHLIWWYTKHIKQLPFLARVDYLYGFLLIAALSMLKPFSHALIAIILTIGTFFLTKIFYDRYENGSLWCWVGNIAALIAIVLPFFR